METKKEKMGKPKELKLTEQQIADFTKLAELQKDGEANGSSRKLITDAYKAFMVENHDALAAKSGVRYIVQAGGSKRDQDVIDECNRLGITMVMNGIRLFHH